MPAARQVTATFALIITLGQAVDNTALSWTTTGDAPWTGQSSISFDGVDAAQSGGLGPFQSGTLSTTVQGPGTLSFRWRVWSQAGFDFLTFLIDGVAQAGAISGETGWLLQTWDIPPGPHTLQWRFAKDASISIGQDRGWVDRVQYTPASGSARLR